MNEDKMNMVCGMYERDGKGCRNFINTQSFERLQVHRRMKLRQILMK
jgi:hypothetical protein